MRLFASCVFALLLLCMSSTAQAVDITIDFNGYLASSGIFVNGPSYSDIMFSSPGPTKTYTGLVAGNTYNVDLLHNPSVDSPDFSFKILADGSGVESVTTSAYGTGSHTMVTGFVPGATTLQLNTFNVIYNANSGQTGHYNGPGAIPTQGQNSGPVAYTAIPGGQNIDNLYNTGGGNEDFAFSVSDAGMVLVPPGTGGGATAIPRSEYYTANGNELNIRSESVHYVLNSDSQPTINPFLPITNDSGWINVGGSFQREFDMQMPIGASGFFVSSYGSFNVTSSDVELPNGTTMEGQTGGNDASFVPTLRYDGTSNGTGFYWMGPGPGIQNSVTATITGFFDGEIVPLNMTVTAFLPEFIPPIPEPGSGLLLGLGALTFALRRRRDK